MDKIPKGKNVLQIMNDKTQQKKSLLALYMATLLYSKTYFQVKEFQWINNGIENHPNRLDMRFGKIYMFGQIEDYETFTKEIIKTIDYSAINQNEWTWADSKPLDDPKEFMLSSIQNYQLQLYNTVKIDRLAYCYNMKKLRDSSQILSRPH